MGTKKNETSKEVATTQSSSVPAYMQKFMQQSQSDAQSMASASISVPRLSFRGKRFRFIEDGDETLVKDLHVDVIILGVEPEAGRMIKTYYDKPYQSGDSEPPTCSSANGVRPDNWISDPQNPTCANCPKNVFGSATSMNGGKSKACKDGKRLWVAKVDNPTSFYGLNVPVTSLRGLSEYGKFIAKNNFPLSLVITRLTLDDEAEFPKLMFEHVGFVEESAVESIMAINEERPWRTDFENTPLLDHQPTQKQVTAPQPQTGVAPSGAGIDEVIGDEWS